METSRPCSRTLASFQSWKGYKLAVIPAGKSAWRKTTTLTDRVCVGIAVWFPMAGGEHSLVKFCRKFGRFCRPSKEKRLPPHHPEEALGNYGRKNNWNEVGEKKADRFAAMAIWPPQSIHDAMENDGKWFVANFDHLSSHLGRRPPPLRETLSGSEWHQHAKIGTHNKRYLHVKSMGFH